MHFECRWRLFRRPIISTPDHVVNYTKAAVALHNLLRVQESTVYCPPGFVDCEDGEGNIIDGSWREEDRSTGMQEVSRTGSNRLVG